MMKRLFWFLMFGIPMAALALDSAFLTVTNFRGEAVMPASSEVYYRGEAVNFTNCVLYSGTTTNSAKQNLTGLTVILTWGDTVLTSQVSTGAVMTATSGTWRTSITLRTNEAVKTYLQVRITDTTNTFVYPFKTLETKAKL